MVRHLPQDKSHRHPPNALQKVGSARTALACPLSFAQPRNGGFCGFLVGWSFGFDYLREHQRSRLSASPGVIARPSPPHCPPPGRRATRPEEHPRRNPARTAARHDRRAV